MPKALELINRYYPGVTEVTDAKRSVRVDVIAEDCTKGNKKSPSSCAMVRALEREKGYDGAIVSVKVAYLIRGDKAMRFRTPESVAREIVSFDRSGDFAPGRYTLKAPSEGETLEGLKKAAKKAAAMRKKRQGEPSRGNEPSGYKNHKTARVRSL